MVRANSMVQSLREANNRLFNQEIPHFGVTQTFITVLILSAEPRDVATCFCVPGSCHVIFQCF
jgi:hypothetical protein